MTRIPFRWFFPAFHFAMDLILVTVLLFQIQAELRREKRPSTAGLKAVRVMRVALPQESGVVEFDPRYIDAPLMPAFALLATSTLPATLMSYWAIPRASFDRIAWRSTERWWLTIYGLTAALFWLLMGRLADRGQQAVYRWCFAFVIIRILGLSVVTSPIWRLGSILQIMFWLSLTIFLVAKSLWMLALRAGIPLKMLRHSPR
jgi:hypothetical protein